MIGRAGCRAERLHFLDQEGHQSLGVEDSLCLLIEICLVGRAASLGNEEEFIFIAFGGVDVDLSGEVAAGVHFIIHGEGSVLRIAEIILGVGLIHAERDFLFIVATGPYLLALVSCADACAGVLAEREHALGGHFGVAEHGESHEAVVVRCLIVVKYPGYHLVVLAAEHKRAVVRGNVGQKSQGFRVNYEHLMAVPVLYLYIVFGDELVFGGIRAERERLLIVERFGWHIKYSVFGCFYT